MDAAGQAYVTGVTRFAGLSHFTRHFPEEFWRRKFRRFRQQAQCRRHSAGVFNLLGWFRFRRRARHCGGLGRSSLRHRPYPISKPDIHNAYQWLRRSTLDDAFLTKFNALGDVVTYSTFLGGSGNEAAHGIVVDDSGLAYLAGETDSTDFVTTSDAFKTEHGGSDLDGFIAKLRTTASKSRFSVYSSFFGGSGNDSIRALAAGLAGTVYITGVTDSTDFPTQDAAQGQFGGGASDAFAAKLNSLGTGLIYSTYLGGTADQTRAKRSRSVESPRQGRLSAIGTGITFVAGVTESK